MEVEGRVAGAIGRGLLVLLGVAHGDTEREGEWMAQKLPALRIFGDEGGKMNLSLADVGGAMLLVSQFTLLGDVRRGRRPSFAEAAPPEEAERLYQYVAGKLRADGVTVETGVFQAHMQVHLVNDGPVTLVLDSKAQGSGAAEGKSQK